MSIRFKLTMAAIAVIVVANSFLTLVGLQYAGHVWLREVQERVRLDLNSARVYYQNHVDGILRFLQGAALGRKLVEAVGQDDLAALGQRLANVHRTGGMDFVSLLDGEGRVILRARNPERRGDDLSSNPLVAEAIAKGEPASGTIILSAEELAREGEDLAARARFELLPTPAARPTPDEVRCDGMVVAAAVPILDGDGRPVVILYGGDLLNRRYEIVDSIKKQVFSPQVYEGRDTGTVTIFQDDLRVSTNVMKTDGSRAVGTRVSNAVYEEVLIRGGTWAAPAFVVNDWYITAYEPIRDPAGRIIGILYVGQLEAPFAHKRNVLTAVFLGMVMVATLASLVLIFFLTRHVLHPISGIIAMSRKVMAGDLSARTGMRPPGEMGLLCQAIDSMADVLAEREQRLKMTTRQQIGQSEKLASIGRLAAGVAHEINNPLTGVLTFAHLVKEEANLDEQGKQDIDLIIRETTRAAEIVRGLLDFARERPAVMQPLDVNEVIRRTIRLLGNQKAFQQIAIVEDLADDLPPVDGDENQLQQVLLNLALNACEAMPDGGTLLVSTSHADGKLLVKVIDTGCGIKAEHLEEIFEPFFSSKPVGKGTGLGLSVSYGIVKQHGGELEVDSREGKGATFTMVLPVVETPAGKPGSPQENVSP